MSVLLYVLIEVTFRDVYNMYPRCPIFGPFLVPKEVKILIFGHFLNTFSLVSHQYCFASSLQVLLEVCGMWGSEAQIFGPFWASKWIKIQFCFHYFVKKFPLDSNQSCFTCSLELLYEMCIIWASKAHFLAILGPKVSKNSGLWSLSQKVFYGFMSVLPHMLIASTFRCVENMGLRGPIFGPLWAPK